MVVELELSEPEQTKSILLELFQRLDTLIAIHYQTNYLSNAIKLSIVSKKILNLTLDNLRKIKHIYNESYELIQDVTNNDIIVDVVVSEKEETVEAVRSNLIKNLNSRMNKFKELIDLYFQDNVISCLDDINNYEIVLKSNKKRSVLQNYSKGRVSKPESCNKKLSNAKSKFEFHEKKAPIVVSSNGVTMQLPLLDRIKLKESQNKLKPSKESVIKLKRDSLLNSKMERIYEILYEQSPKFGSVDKSVSLSINRLKQIVRDSVSLPISNEDVNDVIERLCMRLDLKLVEVGSMKVLKLGRLNRAEDLKLLRG